MVKTIQMNIFQHINTFNAEFTFPGSIKMARRILYSLLIYLLLAGCTAGEEQTKPNVIVLIADDAGYQDFGCYGNPYIRTPHIDRLAAGGLRADNAFLTSPQCSPSRISILTGKYPHQTGAEDLHAPLPATERIIPTYLKQAGYFTGYLLKGHFGPYGEEQFDWYSRDLNDFTVFLDQSGEHPFFLWVGFTDPHRPYDKGVIAEPHSPEKVIVPPYLLDDRATRSDLADYYDHITRMDNQIGQYIDILRERALMENTLLIFFSDNGAPFPRAKGTLYDSGIKTPMIFHWPSVIGEGYVYRDLVSVIDLAPTILAAAGVEPPQIMEGRSLLNILSDPSVTGRKFVYSERNWHNCDEHMRSIRSERYKFISNAYIGFPHGTPADISASPSWKSLREAYDTGMLSPGQALLFKAPRLPEELYDLENDPYELQNLITDPRYTEIAHELRENLALWRAATGDFSAEERRRPDNTDRYSGIKFDQKKLPPFLPDSLSD